MPLREILKATDSLSVPEEIVPRLLHAIRTHLQIEVAFISEFIDGHRVFRYVNADPSTQLLRTVKASGATVN